MKSIAEQCPMEIKCMPGMYLCVDCIVRDFVSSVKILGTIYPMDYDYEDGDKGWEEGQFPENVERYMVHALKNIIENERKRKAISLPESA